MTATRAVMKEADLICTKEGVLEMLKFKADGARDH